MNTQIQPTNFELTLSSIPKFFRNRIIKSYNEVKNAHIEGKFDVCTHKSGRFCEVMIRWLQSRLTGSYIPFTQDINNFKNHCNQIENTPKSNGPDGYRILMPRALSFLYTIRNKRDSGHVGGEVESNSIDSATCARIVDWCLCEVIRIEHSLSLEEAQSLLENIATRQMPNVWNVLGKKRVLIKGLTYAQKSLLLTYSASDYAVPTEDLFDWVEHPDISRFRREVLRKLHNEKLIEYDQDLEMVVLSPNGVLEVEFNLL